MKKMAICLLMLVACSLLSAQCKMKITVNDGYTTPVDMALIQLTRNDSVIMEAYTKDGGKCFLENIPPGKYIVKASKKGHLPSKSMEHVIKENVRMTFNILLGILEASPNKKKKTKEPKTKAVK